MLTPTTIEELQDAIRSTARIKVRGGGTKPALSNNATISTSALTGILEYEPSEFTFTAQAGTPLSEIQSALGENGQFMPFDPPLVESGATIGGTVAAGLSGPGRFRFGGVRDFFLGVRLVTGEGRIVFGGGKVVKNAAGFDFPKLTTGSLGRFGVLVELTFKVFPQPESWATIRAEFADSDEATAALTRVAVSQEEPYCLDLESPSTLWIRLGGLSEAQQARIDRVRKLANGADVTVMSGKEEARIWSDVREFRWVPDDHKLIKLPISPSQISSVDAALPEAAKDAPHRFSVGGNVAWLTLPESVSESEVDTLCKTLHRPTLAILGNWTNPIRGGLGGQSFEQRILSVFDPASKLQPVAETA